MLHQIFMIKYKKDIVFDYLMTKLTFLNETIFRGCEILH